MATVPKPKPTGAARTANSAPSPTPATALVKVDTGAQRIALPAPLASPIVTVEKDIAHWFYGHTMLPRDDTLLSRGGGRGLWIYDDLERDTRVLSSVRKRKMALLAFPWQLDAASESPEDVEARDMVERHFKSMMFAQLVIDQQDAILKGFAVGEILWAVDPFANEIVPAKIIPRDQKRFKFTTDYELRLVTYQNLLEGEPLPDRKFIVHQSGAKDGNPYGLGLGTQLFWPVLFKKMDLTFWLTFLDKFGSPTAVGKFPLGSAPDEVAKLLNALRTIANETNIVIPDNMMVEYLEAQRSGTIDSYERMARYMDEQIAECITGETLTTNIGDVGSQAAATVHNGVRLELSQSDGELLAGTLNASLIKWDVALNRPNARPPTIKWTVDAGEDLNARATRDTMIFGWGYEPSLTYITETYGGEWTRREMPVPGTMPPGAVDDDVQFAERAAQTIADLFAARLGRQNQPEIEKMVGQVRALLFAEGATMESVRDGLIDLYPKLDGHTFARVMERGIVAANLAGAYEAKRR